LVIAVEFPVVTVALFWFPVGVGLFGSAGLDVGSGVAVTFDVMVLSPEFALEDALSVVFALFVIEISVVGVGVTDGKDGSGVIVGSTVGVGVTVGVAVGSVVGVGVTVLGSMVGVGASVGVTDGVSVGVGVTSSAKARRGTT